MKRCYGCMQLKESSPHCEHCGFDERNENSTHQLPLGTVVGQQYILGKVLGQGGFGITYLGWDQITEQTVAVKEYFPSGFAGRNPNTLSITSYDGQDRKSFEHNKLRFLREAESLAKLWNIPQIVKILRCFEENNTAYIAMEYVDGCDLRRYLKQKGHPLTIEETLDILGPIIEALSLVHQAGLVHRDISPDNIMVLPDGSAKLLDFGAARYVENADAEKERATSTQAILKHGFAPPEQYQSHGALGPWTDVYAICATIYYCLTGKVPPEAMSRMIERRPLHWDIVPGLTSRQRSVLEKAMALNPKDRFASAQELWSKLGAKKKKDPNSVALPKNEKAPNQKSEDKKESPKKALSPAVRHTSAKPVREKKAANTTDQILALIAVTMAILTVIGLFSSRKPEEHTFVHPENTPQTTEILVPGAAAESAEVPLEIASLLEFEDAQLGKIGTIAVLSDHDPQNLKWSSDEPAVASVSENGTVTAVGYGKAEITAQYDSQVVSCTVYVDRTPNVVCTYEENETGLTITGYEGEPSGELVLPRKIDGRNVTEIGDFAFNYCKITGVYIPEGITEIGYAAFTDCASLTQATIPESMISIRGYAFSKTKLSEVLIPDTITYMESGVFYLTPWLRSHTEDFVICGDGILIRYNGNASDVVIPSTVKLICNPFADSGSRINSVTIPDSVTCIGQAAFAACQNLTSITIPDSVISIEDRAFYHCKSLTSIYIPKTVISIGNMAFYECTQLQSVAIEEGVTTIGPSAFYNCKNLTGIDIPDSIASIGAWAFFGCSNLKEIHIPEGLTSIEAQAFRTCSSLTSVYLPDSVTSIGNEAFLGCLSLSEVRIPDNVTFIGCNAFDYTPWFDQQTDRFVIVGDGVLIKYNHVPGRLVVVFSIPDTVKSISSAFQNISSIKMVTIPDTVTYIGDYAFSGCKDLINITLSKNATYIGEYAFGNCSSLSSISIPNGITTIERSTFDGCTALKTITIPDSVNTICYRAFHSCGSIREITIPSSVTTIENQAFFGSYNLTNVTVSKDCTIGERAFTPGCVISYY